MSILIRGYWKANVGSQEILGVTGKFGLGVQNEAGQSSTVLPREHTGHEKHPLPKTQEKRVFVITSAFSWQNSISLFPASFRIPRPNLSLLQVFLDFLLLYSNPL